MLHANMVDKYDLHITHHYLINDNKKLEAIV